MEGVFKKEDRKILLAYIAVCIFWGSTYLAIRIGVQELPPTIFAGVRFLIAGTLMLIYAKHKNLAMPENKEQLIKISIVGIFLLVGGNGVVVWAETRVSSGVACLILATCPLFVAIIEYLSPSRVRLNKFGWLGLLIGFSGVAFLVISDFTKAYVDLIGFTLLMISTLSWSFGSVYSKSFKSSASTVTSIAIQMLSGGIVLTIVGSFLGEFQRVNLTVRGLGALFYLIIFGSIVGYSCYMYILNKWPAAKAGTYAYVNPPVAVFLGAVVLGEPITIKIVFATIIILCGVIMTQRSKIVVDKAENKSV